MESSETKWDEFTKGKTEEADKKVDEQVDGMYSNEDPDKREKRKQNIKDMRNPEELPKAA